MLKIRQITEISPKIISKLLNVTVHTYNAYEQERMTPPPEVIKMLSMMYRIDESLLTAESVCIDEHSMAKLQVIENLSETDKLSYLSAGLLGENTVPNYHNIRMVKDNIAKTLASKKY